MIVESFDNLVAEIVGRRHAIVATLAGSLFLFIACCNIAGQLPGVHPATGSLATTSALAVVVFLSVPIAGIRTNGAEKTQQDVDAARISLQAELSELRSREIETARRQADQILAEARDRIPKQEP